MNRAVKVGYELNEEDNWSISVEDLERIYNEHTLKHPETKIRALCVINPSNPCGSVLQPSTVHKLIEFCTVHDLTLLADKVY